MDTKKERTDLRRERKSSRVQQRQKRLLRNMHQSLRQRKQTPSLLPVSWRGSLKTKRLLLQDQRRTEDFPEVHH